MEWFANYLADNPIITVIIAAIIFVIALVSVVKRIFSFIVTLIFLGICLVSGYIVIYPNSAIDYFKELAEDGKTHEKKEKSISQQIEKTYEDIKKKAQDYYENLKKDDHRKRS